MRVLVTGASGQLGSALARALVQRGDQVRCLLRRPEQEGLLEGLSLERVGGDLQDADSLRAACEGQEAVLHCAGVISYWRRKRGLQEAVNHHGTLALLEAARDAGVRRLLFTSSIATLGFVEGEGQGDEDSPWNWGPHRIGYFETKRAAEQAVLAAGDLEGLAVNPGILLGSGDVYQGGGRMLLQLARGELPGVPPGATTAANLRDVVEGHLLALDRGAPGRRYVLGGTCASFLELYTRIAAVMELPPPQRVLPAWLIRSMGQIWGGWAALSGQEPSLTPELAAIVTRNRQYASRRAEEELGYRARPLEEGIRACLEDYQARGWIAAD